MRLLTIAVLVVLVLGLAATGALYLWIPPHVEQPLAFNHQLHVEESGMDCTDCHLYAESGARATIPNVTVCADCHSEVLTESEVEARLVEYVEAEQLIPWRKVYWVPAHVVFSHRRHTAVAGLECEACHGPIAAAVEPVSRPFQPISMDGCMECHYEQGASNDCIACHR